MSPDHVVELVQRTLALGASVAAPILGAGLLVGLVVAILQAATQVQESALGFVPKLAAMGGALAFAGPWLLNRLLSFMGAVIEELAHLGPSGSVF